MTSSNIRSGLSVSQIMRLIALSGLAGLAACEGPAGPAGAQGDPGVAGDTGASGAPCDVVDNGDGSFTMTCADTGPVTFGATEAPQAYLDASVAVGGQLYDKYWDVDTVTAVAPTTDNPMYPAFGAKSGGDTWRCKECHGWDYIGKDGRYGSGSHYTGIAGIYPPTQSVMQAFATIRDGHGYGAQGLTDAEIWDLVKFYKEGTFDFGPVLDTNGNYNGDIARGAGFFADGLPGNDGTAVATVESCASCHSADGTDIAPDGHNGFLEFPGFLTNENPQEALHKIRYGQPGTDMPGNMQINGSIQDALDLGAFAQTLPPVPWGANDVDVARGGRIYDAWWEENGTAEPTTDNPMYPAGGTKSGSNTWRCKECHGWDYIGDQGRYATGSHYTGIMGLLDSNMNRYQAFQTIKNNHGFGAAGLSDQDIWDVVAFYWDGMYDTGFITDDHSFNGSAAAGETLYTNGVNGADACAACHGADGWQIPGIEAPGFLSNDAPVEFLHKIFNGVPATPMAVGYDHSMTMQQAADLGAYAQTLPMDDPNIP